MTRVLQLDKIQIAFRQGGSNKDTMMTIKLQSFLLVLVLRRSGGNV